MSRTILLGLTITLSATALTCVHQRTANDPSGTAPVLASYIVEAESVAAARAAVRSVGGEVGYDLPIIDAVAARLSSAQHQQLAQLDAIRRVSNDAPVKAASSLSSVRDN